MIHAIPDCFGEYNCPDDCDVSCAYWEECMQEHYHEDSEEDEGIEE